jgi:DNA-binding protein H-NS
MAKAVRGRPRRKKVAEKAPVPAKRKAAAPRVPSNKLRALVYNLTPVELDELIKLATGRKSEHIASAKASFLVEVKAKAASLGMSLSDLVGLGAGNPGPGLNVNGKPPLVPKYRNPATQETWSGRGRPARWLTDLEAKGRKRQEFAI